MTNTKKSKMYKKCFGDNKRQAYAYLNKLAENKDIYMAQASYHVPDGCYVVVYWYKR